MVVPALAVAMQAGPPIATSGQHGSRENVTGRQYGSPMRTVSSDEVNAMLAAVAERHGLTLDQLRELASRDELVDPELRDLWLIWGDSTQG